MSEDAPIVPLRAVASRAGVSVSTASRALTGRGDLARSTRERVLAVAQEMRYERSREAGGRPSISEPRLIELVLADFGDEWTDEVGAGARSPAFALGYDLALTLEGDDPDDDWTQRVAKRCSAGVVLGLIRPNRGQLDVLRSLRIPLVLFDPRSSPRGEINSVGATNWQGGYDAGAHLVGTGLQRFAIVTGVPRFSFGEVREDGFRAAIRERLPGADVPRLSASWSGADVQALLRVLVRQEDSPLGVFACNDEMALAIYAAADALRLRIPHDVSVIGFNDEPQAAAATPPLTSVRQPLRAMAARAVDLIRDRRACVNTLPEQIELPTTLMVRGSTRSTPTA